MDLGAVRNTEYSLVDPSNAVTVYVKLDVYEFVVTLLIYSTPPIVTFCPVVVNSAAYDETFVNVSETKSILLPAIVPVRFNEGIEYAVMSLFEKDPEAPKIPASNKGLEFPPLSLSLNTRTWKIGFKKQAFRKNWK